MRINIMHHEYLDSRFLFPNPLLPLGDFLRKFSEQSLFPVAIRSLDKGQHTEDMKVIMHNKPSGELRGFKEGGMVGMTFIEILDSLNMSAQDKEAEIEAVEKNDQEAIANNTQSTHTQITLDAQGFIRIFQRIVTPLSGYKNKPIAISTTSLELTQYTNLLHLFQYYKKYYSHDDSKLPKSLEKFSHYLKLDDYFKDPLNSGEMTALLAMVSDSRHKQAAEFITAFSQKPCAARTVSTYVSLIRGKLKSNIDIHMVLRSLRDHHQLPSYLAE